MERRSLLASCLSYLQENGCVHTSEPSFCHGFLHSSVWIIALTQHSRLPGTAIEKVPYSFSCCHCARTTCSQRQLSQRSFMFGWVWSIRNGIFSQSLPRRTCLCDQVRMCLFLLVLLQAKNSLQTSPSYLCHLRLFTSPPWFEFLCESPCIHLIFMLDKKKTPQFYKSLASCVLSHFSPLYFLIPP